MEPLTYYDRDHGAFRTERVHGERFLDWLYNTRSGDVLRGLLIAPWLSRVYGWNARQPWSRRRIRPFVDRMGIDMSESVRRIDEFRSFGEFFVRELDPARRPVCPEAGVCTAPADGKLLAYPRVAAGETFRIKRSTFNLAGFLGEAALAEAFGGGSMVVVRLTLADGHHFHFPDSGVPRAPVVIDGRLHAGGPYARRRLVPFYAENHRVVTLFDSDHFGPMAIVEVGALTVGSIRQQFRPGIPVVKGARKGFFELGGSTVVLLFRPGRVALDRDLCRSTAEEVETGVRRGESIGRATSPGGAS
jgi:phosphatidylserine decarboxylase